MFLCPIPARRPRQLPPIDGQAASLLPLPVNFPDYNSIDSIDTMNVVRFGLRNILQTKRDGQLEDLVNWNVLMDWRLDPRPGQEHFNDLYSALTFRPRTWLTASSQLRYDVQGGELNLAFHELTFSPSDRWSWGVSHWYLRSGFVSPDENNFIVSTLLLPAERQLGRAHRAHVQRHGWTPPGAGLYHHARPAELDDCADLPGAKQRGQFGGFHRGNCLLAQGGAVNAAG